MLFAGIGLPPLGDACQEHHDLFCTDPTFLINSSDVSRVSVPEDCESQAAFNFCAEELDGGEGPPADLVQHGTPFFCKPAFRKSWIARLSGLRGQWTFGSCKTPFSSHVLACRTCAWLSSLCCSFSVLGKSKSGLSKFWPSLPFLHPALSRGPLGGFGLCLWPILWSTDKGLSRNCLQARLQCPDSCADRLSPLPIFA